jgi:hypothetical protein
VVERGREGLYGRPPWFACRRIVEWPASPYDGILGQHLTLAPVVAQLPEPPLIPLDDAGMPASVIYYSDDVAFHELLYRMRRSSGPSITI